VRDGGTGDGRSDAELERRRGSRTRDSGMAAQGTAGTRGPLTPRPIPPQSMEDLSEEDEPAATERQARGSSRHPLQQPVPFIVCTFQREPRGTRGGPWPGRGGGPGPPCQPLPLPQDPTSSSFAVTSSRRWSWHPAAPRPPQVGPPRPPGPHTGGHPGVLTLPLSPRPRRPRLLRARQPENPGAAWHPGPPLGPDAAFSPGAALRGPPGCPGGAPRRGGGGLRPGESGTAALGGGHPWVGGSTHTHATPCRVPVVSWGGACAPQMFGWTWGAGSPPSFGGTRCGGRGGRPGSCWPPSSCCTTPR